ncbi:ParB/RepB/Spo0J family partition protein [Thiothrix fructosivorans]|uniref:ParB/RepB/Spo0J family partition protein n=1 Tax=Thiothrix fructosivorans TaxID=111770 RepID=A0A8B0SVG4_9GAMM|nr:ParB/RepB/Spo0J family partition protein [Thiothrix fructosivorans]MBO0611492.1 ParB/RepB/Spo0J family partition protein [Thiothrix fructosivorans]QTX12952.1 ParB/RepB/Spo0J family partition protein [Thiothrix fructosivorans]
MMDTDFGLDSLAAELEAGGTVVAELLVQQISPDPEQPRKKIDPDKLQQLADSIKAQGVIQPIVVRNGEVFDSYIIVAGERRWRASQIAGRTTIPAVVRDISLTEIIAAQIIENIDREGFSLLDEVRAVMRMCDICGSAKVAAEALGKSKAWISQRVKIGTVGGIIETFIEEGDSTDVMGTYQLARFTEKYPEEGRQFIDNWIQHPESRGSLREKVAESFLQMDRSKLSPTSSEPSSPMATDSGLDVTNKAVPVPEIMAATGAVNVPAETVAVPGQVDETHHKTSRKAEPKPEHVVNFRIEKDEVYLQTNSRTIVINEAMLRVIYGQL